MLAGAPSQGAFESDSKKRGSLRVHQTTSEALAASRQVEENTGRLRMTPDDSGWLR